MQSSKSTKTNAELKREIAGLKLQVTHWKGRVAAIEARLAVTLPILSLQFDGKPVRLIVHQSKPLVQAADVIEHLAGVPKKYPGRRGPGFIDRLRRAGLGAREAVGLKSDELADNFGTTRMHLCHALGRGAKTSDLGFVTALGIETLRDRAPEFCAWVEREAFPAVITRFGKGGAA